jgi:pimeloyl-ACP methyl ester carboxylesterase
VLPCNENRAVPIAMRTLEWGVGKPHRALLVHGVQAAANCWWQIAEGLARADVHVTAPDLRGHGASPTAGSYLLADFVADLQELGSAWDLVVGHSLGATVIAAALVTNTGLTSHAVLIEPVLELAEDGFDEIVAGQLAELGAANADALLAAHPGWHPEDCRLKMRTAAECSPFVNEAVLRENRPWAYAGLLAQAQAETLVLGGELEHGAMLDPHLGFEIADAHPNIRYRQLEGAGHSPHRDQPGTVIDLLLAELG